MGLAALAATAPRQAAAAALAVVTFYYAGQFGAMPLGLAAGGHPAIIGLYVWTADMAGLLVFFPLTQLGIERLAQRRGRVAHWIRALQGRADKHRAFIDRYGPRGLFGFTVLPFLFNSPILGAVIGRVAGLTGRRTLAALVSAVTFMTVLWASVFHFGLQRALSLDPRLPWLIAFGTVAATFLGLGIVALARTVRRRRVGFERV